MYYQAGRIRRVLKDIKGLINPDSIEISAYRIREGNFTDGSGEELDDSGWDIFRCGEQWGGLDKHFWFRTAVKIPEKFRGKTVTFNIKTGAEGDWDALNPQFLFYLDGKLQQGLDVNHREVLIDEGAEPGRVYRIALLAYSGMIDRKSNLFTSLSVLDREIEKLYYDIDVPLSAAELMDAEDKNRIDILNGLDPAVDMLDMRKPLSDEFYASVRKAGRYLKEEFYGRLCGAKSPVVTGIGHTHIDVAWLWTLSQTREKAARSFSTALNLMKQYPEYKFMSSQPQLYQYVKEDQPEVYDGIKEMVREGRWEPEGAMWLEADCNLTSGESLVRQILFGKRFFQREFGVDSRILWLPDVFGYSAALPQILKKSGIDYFMTTKISWSETDQMPMDTFIWRGIDGSEVFTHFITTKDYSNRKDEGTTYVGNVNPNQVMGAWDRYRNKDINDEVLMSFGYGDGGGGPTKEMLENAKRLKYGIPGCPVFRIDFAGSFFDRVYNRVKDNKNLPTWVGELYLEYHRGTYTSMARNKKYNRRSEFLFEDAEMLSSLNAMLGAEYPSETLNSGWRTILLNQFHDILPGSAIEQVYQDSKEQYEEVLSSGRGIVRAAIHGISSRINLKAKSVVVFNTLSYVRDDIVEFEMPKGYRVIELADDDGNAAVCQCVGSGRAVFFARGIPAKGYKSYRIAAGKRDNMSGLTIDEHRMRNRFFDVKFDQDYNISSIYDLRRGREVIKEGRRGNVLQAFEDKPMGFENWNVDIYYQRKMYPVNDVSAAEVTERGPVRCCLRVSRNFCDSAITQYIYMYNDIPRIDFRTCIDWKEKQMLLKAAFPVEINSNRASYEIQYGNVERDTHWNTSWDAAKFEVCAQKWADLSESGYGVSLLNDCKYGYDIKDSVIRLTLLKCGTDPNPNADREHHEFTYSLYPHCGGWREAGVQTAAYNLNVPAYGAVEEAHQGNLPPHMSMVSVDSGNVMVEVVKKAEDGDGLVIRLYEYMNSRGSVRLTLCRPIDEAWECDLLENAQRKIDVDGNSFTFAIKPYEIKTFMVRPK